MGVTQDLRDDSSLSHLSELMQHRDDGSLKNLSEPPAAEYQDDGSLTYLPELQEPVVDDQSSLSRLLELPEPELQEESSESHASETHAAHAYRAKTRVPQPHMPESHVWETSWRYAADLCTLPPRARAASRQLQRKLRGWNARVIAFHEAHAAHRQALVALTTDWGRSAGSACPTALTDVYLWTGVCLAGWHLCHVLVALVLHGNAIGRPLARAVHIIETVLICRPFLLTVVLLTVLPYEFYRQYLKPAAVKQARALGDDERLTKWVRMLTQLSAGATAAITSVYLGGFKIYFLAPLASTCPLIVGILFGTAGKLILGNKRLVLGSTLALTSAALLAWGHAQSALSDPCYQLWMWAACLHNLVHVRSCVDDAARCGELERRHVGDGRFTGSGNALWWQWAYVVSFMWLHFYLVAAIFVRDQLAKGMPKEPACMRNWADSYETIMSATASFDGDTRFFHKFGRQ